MAGKRVHKLDGPYGRQMDGWTEYEVRRTSKPPLHHQCIWWVVGRTPWEHYPRNVGRTGRTPLVCGQVWVLVECSRALMNISVTSCPDKISSCLVITRVRKFHGTSGTFFTLNQSPNDFSTTGGRSEHAYFGRFPSRGPRPEVSMRTLVGSRLAVVSVFR